MANHRRTAQVEITISWGSTVVQTLSLCPPRAIQAGDGECPVPAERLGVPRRPLLVVPDGEPRLVVWPGANGTITLPGERARPIQHLVADGGAQPCRGSGDLLTLPLPIGSCAELVLDRRSAQSVYRAPVCDDGVVLRVVVAEASRWMRYRSRALRYGAVASLALSLLAHGTVFATEPAPVLAPTVEGDPDADTSSYLLAAMTGTLAEREPDVDWDRIDAPLDSTPAGPWGEYLGCSYPTLGSLLSCGVGTGFREATQECGADVCAWVPPELSSCFAGPAREPEWHGARSVAIQRAQVRATPARDGRRHRLRPGAELVGYLVVDDAEELPASEVPSWSQRAPRSRHPRFAFGEGAAQVLERGLARAETAFGWCYQRALQDRPQLSGRVALRIAAPDARGNVDAASTDLDDPELQCCLANAQRLWTGRVYGDGELRYVLDLHRAP